MLCDDFARLGYKKVVVDAGVQLSYDWHIAKEMSARECSWLCVVRMVKLWLNSRAACTGSNHHMPDLSCCNIAVSALSHAVCFLAPRCIPYAVGVEGLGQSTWAQAKAAGIAGADRTPNYANTECCGAKRNYVDFLGGCERRDTMAVNYTARVLQGRV